MIDKAKLRKNVDKVRSDTKGALQTIYDAMNRGQQKQIVKNAAVKGLFDLYDVEYEK